MPAKLSKANMELQECYVKKRITKKITKEKKPKQTTATVSKEKKRTASDKKVIEIKSKTKKKEEAAHRVGAI